MPRRLAVVLITVASLGACADDVDDAMATAPPVQRPSSPEAVTRPADQAPPAATAITMADLLYGTFPT